MTSFHIKPSRLQGTIRVPSSKSHTLRALFFAMMGKGTSVIKHPLDSPDTEAMIVAIRQFGAKVMIHEDFLEVEGVAGHLQPAEDVIQSGNSGQVLRFIGAIASLLPSYTVLTGDHSIRHNRPIQPLVEALNHLGVFATSSRLDGYAPMIVKGPIRGHHTTLSGEDSQPVSALLMTTCFLPQKTTIDVTNAGEKPWIDLTLAWFKKLGIQVEHKYYEHYIVHGSAKYDSFEVTIPGDWSSASYPIAAALVTKSKITLHNVDMNDVQGDKKLVDILIQMGAIIDIDVEKRTLAVHPTSQLKGMKIDINDCIDMITILPVIACFAEGKTEIVNAGIARKKESDRVHAITTELRKMGALIEEYPDSLVITPSKLHGAHVKSYSDHRMTLALSVAALGAVGDSQIDGAECIAKTYQNFAQDFRALGAQISCT